MPSINFPMMNWLRRLFCGQTFTQTSTRDWAHPIAVEEIKVFINILLLSGYCKVANRELYCSKLSDTHNESVSHTASRNCFREVFTNIHIRDNIAINNNCYYKVRSDCMFLSFDVRVSGWIYTLLLPECQGTPCSKQAQDLKFKTHNHLVHKRTHNQLAKLA